MNPSVSGLQRFPLFAGGPLQTPAFVLSAAIQAFSRRSKSLPDKPLTLRSLLWVCLWLSLMPLRTLLLSLWNSSCSSLWFLRAHIRRSSAWRSNTPLLLTSSSLFVTPHCLAGSVGRSITAVCAGIVKHADAVVQPVFRSSLPSAGFFFGDPSFSSFVVAQFCHVIVGQPPTSTCCAHLFCFHLQ